MGQRTDKLKIADHLKELRLRLTWSAAVFMVGGAIGYLLRKPLIVALRKPLDETLYYTNPAGGFNFVMKISVVVGLAFALPVIIFNFVKFLQPAAAQHVKNHHVRIITLVSLLLAIAGGAFAFWVVVPMSLHFFKEFKDANVTSLISANDYLNFVINCIISFMIIFQLPLLILFADRIRPLPPRKLIKYEKYVVVGSLLIALVLPFTYDPLSQFLVALPIIILYNLSIIFVLFVHSRRERTTRTARKHNPQPKPTVFKPVNNTPTKPTPTMPAIMQSFAESQSKQTPQRTKPVRSMDGVVGRKPPTAR